MPQPSEARFHVCTVACIERVTRDIVKLRLACPELARTARPGQFFNLRVPGDPTHLLRLPFSWSAKDAGEGWVETLVRVVGEGTERLAGLCEGTQTDLLGPGGNGWTVADGLGRCLLVGEGVGTVPLVALAPELRARSVACDCVFGFDVDPMPYSESLESAGCALDLYMGPKTAETSDAVARRARLAIEGGAYDAVFACGSERMMSQVANAAQAAGIPCQVSMERKMTCGFGACTTCLVDTRHGRDTACKCGPVFDAQEVIW